MDEKDKRIAELEKKVSDLKDELLVAKNQEVKLLHNASVDEYRLNKCRRKNKKLKRQLKKIHETAQFKDIAELLSDSRSVSRRLVMLKHDLENLGNEHKQEAITLEVIQYLYYIFLWSIHKENGGTENELNEWKYILNEQRNRLGVPCIQDVMNSLEYGYKRITSDSDRVEIAEHWRYHSEV